MSVLYFAVYEEATGRIVRTVNLDTSMVFEQIGGQAQAGEALCQHTDVIDPLLQYVSLATKRVVAFSPRPSAAHVWDWGAMRWRDPRTLDDMKATRWAEMKARRDAAEFGGFVWNGLAFDSDSMAQSRIQGGVQLAAIAQAQGQPFSMDWTLADNTVRTLSASDMVAVGIALALHVEQAHARGRALRVAIEAATTIRDVEGIVWA